MTNCKMFVLEVKLKSHDNLTLRGNAAYLKNIYIMGGNDSLPKYSKIPLGHNRTNGAVYSKIYFKIEICSAR